MQKPNFDSIVSHARVREARATGPQAIPHNQRIFKCECCNDSGVVQAWKLNRWAKRVMDEPLDAIMSLPVLCTRYNTCGEVEIQVFADKDRDENAPRTSKRNFVEGDKIGDLIKHRKVRVLSYEQSQYIHDRVLEYRELLATTEQGQQYVEGVKTALRDSIPEKTRPRLHHISEIFSPALLPDEPDLTAPERVEVVSPRDFTPTPDPAPLEPNVELDGVTLLTNADPTDLSDLPF